ncbi:MAG: tetratricopeptide repeat protein [Candidatus Hydrogenedentes bacterium]|nr:tetratricopeptide repeat protein [Candidatus Hydrogenedentota bacterium]
MFAMLEDLQLAEGLFEQAGTCADDTMAQHLAINWADTKMRLGHPEEALAMLQAAHEKYPANPDVHWALARTYVSVGNIPQAVQEYEALMESPEVTNNGKARLLEEMRALL